MVRPLLLALLLMVVLVSPVLASQSGPTPSPPAPTATIGSGVPGTTPVAIPTRSSPVVRGSTPIPGPREQPGLFATDPGLLARDPTGPFLRGDNDQLAVVGVYPDDSGNDVLVALRNNTRSDIRGAEVTATLRDGDATVALGITTDIAPATIVPGGLAFGLVTLEGADGRLSDANLPYIDVRETERNSQAAEAELRLVSATVAESEVLAAIAVDSGAVAAFQMVVVCVRQAGSHYVLVSGWSSSVTLYEVLLETGDTTTLRSNPPTDCGDRYLVAVASF